jgi:hypothetical protein
MGSLAYVEVDRNDVDNDEDSRIIVIRDEERVGDEDDEVSPRDSRSGRLSGTPAVAVCSFVVGCLFGSLAVFVGGYWRAFLPPNISCCERAAVFGDQEVTPEVNEMAMGEYAANAFVILEKMKHDPTAFT